VFETIHLIAKARGFRAALIVYIESIKQRKVITLRSIATLRRMIESVVALLLLQDAGTPDVAGFRVIFIVDADKHQQVLLV
jgi:hypothetical protein